MLKKQIILSFLCLIGLFLTFKSFANTNTLLIGDSLMGTISNSYKKINKEEKIDIKYIVGSGLENKKFNWFNYIDNKDLSDYSNIVISIGTNDFTVSNQELYRQKIEKFILSIKSKNPDVNIYWVGPPTVKKKIINDGINTVRDIIEKSIEKEQALINIQSDGQKQKNNSIKFIDVRNILGDTFYLYKDRKKIRTDDGIHYTSFAGDLIVNELNKVMCKCK